MRRIKRFASALQRYRHSRGFGIHSPFAFHFVVRVLREKSPYYCYPELKARRKAVVRLVAHDSGRMHVMSMQNAKMLVRLAAFFNPRRVLVIGAHYGLGVSALLSTDSRSTAVQWEGPRCFHDVFSRLTASMAGRISLAGSLTEALMAYEGESGDDFFVLVNDVAGASADECAALVSRCVSSGGTVVVRHIDDSADMARLWRSLSEAMNHGMTFGNGKIGVAVMRDGLPRQHFSLWF